MPYGSSGEVWQGNYFVPPNNGKAVAAMVLGIVSILFSFFLGFGILPGLVAVPLGIAALSTAKRVRVGKGMAIAGICCGAVGVLLSGLILAAFVLAVNEIEGQIEARERPGHIHAADNEWVKVEGMQFHNVDDGLMTIGREVDTYLFEMDELPQSLMQVYEPLPTDPWERTFIIRIHRRNGTDKYVIMSQGADVASELDDIVYDGESGRIQIGPLRFGNTEKSQEFIQPKD